MPASSLFAQVALSNCRDAVVHNVHNWAFSFIRGLRALGYKLTLRCDQLDVVDVACVKELLWNSHSRVWIFQLAHVLHVMPRFVHISVGLLGRHMLLVIYPGRLPKYMFLPLP